MVPPVTIKTAGPLGALIYTDSLTLKDAESYDLRCYLTFGFTAKLSLNS